MGIRRTVAAALALAVLPIMVLLPAADADNTRWNGDATGWGGTSTYDGREWIHQDFVYDDYGADTCSCGQPNVVSLVGTTGDYRYPTGDEFRGNAADIVEVRVRQRKREVAVRVTLSTLVDPMVPALYVAHNSGAPVYVTTSAFRPGERIVTALDDDVIIDAEANTIEFLVPIGYSDRFSLLLGAGLHDGEGGLREGVTGIARLSSPNDFTTGGPATGGDIAGRLFDLAFNTEALEGRGGGWNENAQSAALKTGDLSAFAVEIDLKALRKRTGPAFELGEGYHIGILDSRQTLGEGVAGSFPQYRSRHQPYAVWVPAGYDPATPTPFYLSMHSLNSSHNQYRGGGGFGASYATYYEQLGDDIDALVATPLGRGPDGWYEAEALVDTLEVWSDMQERFTIDSERIYAGGYSMGGYGTYRLTTMMPDAFASAAVVVGPMTNGIWAYPLPPEVDGREDRPDNTYHQLESTLHVPTSIKHGTNDELVPVSGVIHHAERYKELGHEYQFNLFAGQDHLSFAALDGWQEEAAWLAGHPTRSIDPRQVTLDIRPSTWIEGAGTRAATIESQLRELVAEVGADIDGGYWVDGVALRSEAGDATGEIDLISGGIGTAQTAADELPAVGVNDAIGPYVRQETRRSAGTVGTSDTLSGTLVNVADVTIDLDRAGLSDTPDLSGIATDGPVQVTLVRGATHVDTVTIGG